MNETVRPAPAARIVEKIHLDLPKPSDTYINPEAEESGAPAATQIKVVEKPKAISDRPGEAKTEPAAGETAKPEADATQETKAEEGKPEAEPKAPSAKAFAALAKQEKELARKRNELKAERQQLAGQFTTAVAQKVDEYKAEIRKRILLDPIGALKEFNVDYDQLSQVMVNGGTATPDLKIKALEQEIQAIKESGEKRVQDESLRLTEQKNQAIQRFWNDCRNHVQQNAEEYELINLNRAYNLVPQLVEEYFGKTGKVLEISEAAKQVEDYLFDNSLKAKKIQAKVTPQPQADGKAKSQSQGAKTLSNADVHQAPSKMRPLSEEERLARVHAAFDRLQSRQ